jgi:hypothetical protein
MLVFSFFLGPLEVFCIAHLPTGDGDLPLTYIKVQLCERRVRSLANPADQEEWLAEEAGSAATPTDHASIEGMVPGSRGRVIFSFGPVRFMVTEDGRVRAKLVPQRDVDVSTKFVDHWVAR